MNQDKTIELKTLNPETREPGKAITVEIKRLPPSWITLVFDAIKLKVASATVAAKNEADTECQELFSIMNDLPERSKYRENIEKEYDTARRNLAGRKKAAKEAGAQFSEIPEFQQEEGAESYLREIADEICCETAVLEIATGMKISDFVEVESLEEFERLCEAVKDVNNRFLLMFLKRLQR